jgi:hypothetical protein
MQTVVYCIIITRDDSQLINAFIDNSQHFIVGLSCFSSLLHLSIRAEHRLEEEEGKI